MLSSPSSGLGGGVGLGLGGGEGEGFGGGFGVGAGPGFGDGTGWSPSAANQIAAGASQSACNSASLVRIRPSPVGRMTSRHVVRFTTVFYQPTLRDDAMSRESTVETVKQATEFVMDHAACLSPG